MRTNSAEHSATTNVLTPYPTGCTLTSNFNFFPSESFVGKTLRNFKKKSQKPSYL